MKLTKPIESMSTAEILELFHENLKRANKEPKFPLFYDRLVKLSAELFGGGDE